MADFDNAVKPVVVDASGLSCPQPVMLTKKALSEHDSGCIVVLVDTATSKNNVSRFAENKGWTVAKVDERNEKPGWRVVLVKK